MWPFPSLVKSSSTGVVLSCPQPCHGRGDAGGECCAVEHNLRVAATGGPSSAAPAQCVCSRGGALLSPRVLSAKPLVSSG